MRIFISFVSHFCLLCCFIFLCFVVSVTPSLAKFLRTHLHTYIHTHMYITLNLPLYSNAAWGVNIYISPFYRPLTPSYINLYKEHTFIISKNILYWYQQYRNKKKRIFSQQKYVVLFKKWSGVVVSLPIYSFFLPQIKWL